MNRPCLSAQPSVALYPRKARSNTRSLNRYTRPCPAAVSGFSRRAHIIGVVVSDTRSEIRIATESTTANSRNSRPTIPPISKMGMNTAIRDRLIESTVNPTSREPCSAACSGDSPSSMRRVTFSSTTIVSSTTNPVAMVSAMSERLLML